MNTATRSGSPLGRIPLPSPDCRSCGFTSGLIRQDAIADTLQEYAAGWQRLLRAPGLSGRRTGTPSWSLLESGCHVRDMCLLFHTRLDAILGQSLIAPRLSVGVGTDTARRYRDEEPQQVAEELGRAAEALARRLAALTDDDWERGDPRLADPRLTVGFFTRHLLHDIAHDLARAVRESSGQ
ncbi:DinB family protein [Streptomyces thermoalcalitolerans]|uniref:Maleylpyruvate isomerase N-terminal domain-containing protein n=1 Tax=Streptomyces thermoalcalitolerans TaxID=65605 RepID=A0ABP3ZEL6_9ACTN